MLLTCQPSSCVTSRRGARGRGGGGGGNGSTSVCAHAHAHVERLGRTASRTPPPTQRRCRAGRAGRGGSGATQLTAAARHDASTSSARGGGGGSGGGDGLGFVTRFEAPTRGRSLGLPHAFSDHVHSPGSSTYRRLVAAGARRREAAAGPSAAATKSAAAAAAAGVGGVPVGSGGGGSGGGAFAKDSSMGCPAPSPQPPSPSTIHGKRATAAAAAAAGAPGGFGSPPGGRGADDVRPGGAAEGVRGMEGYLVDIFGVARAGRLYNVLPSAAPADRTRRDGTAAASGGADGCGSNAAGAWPEDWMGSRVALTLLCSALAQQMRLEGQVVRVPWLCR
eukprot:364341-Chlamydomonas_euryale.AAC.17